jgi:hypothetical protein
MKLIIDCGITSFDKKTKRVVRAIFLERNEFGAMCVKDIFEIDSDNFVNTGAAAFVLDSVFRDNDVFEEISINYDHNVMLSLTQEYDSILLSESISVAKCLVAHLNVVACEFNGVYDNNGILNDNHDGQPVMQAVLIDKNTGGDFHPYARFARRKQG